MSQLELPWWACADCGEDVAICQCPSTPPLGWSEGWDARIHQLVWVRSTVFKPIVDLIADPRWL